MTLEEFIYQGANTSGISNVSTTGLCFSTKK